MAAPDSHPCVLNLSIPFPTPRLATAALRALRVDKELSNLVIRALTLSESDPCVLQVEYKATTNRMLRVAVNGFMESLKVVIGCMEELDVDVLGGDIKGGLEGVQGLE